MLPNRNNKRAIVVRFTHLKYFLPIRLTLHRPETCEEMSMYDSEGGSQKEFANLLKDLILSSEQHDLISNLSIGSFYT